jgi:OOP family OmpA-OmpF porin
MTRQTGLNIRGYLPHALAILFAGAACLGAGVLAKEKIEELSVTDIGLALSQAGHDWAEVTADGLQVTLFGTAPNEATRFAALSAAGRVVDASRISDEMRVTATARLAAPDFSVEILKNDDGISIIGLVPVESDPGTILERARRMAGTAQITDLLESAEFAPPAGWERALAFGLASLEDLPRSKISIRPGSVSITAAATDEEQKRRIERTLNRDAPSGIALALDISAPRPVIAPFTLRFVIDEGGAHFDACSATSESGRNAILQSAIAAGLSGDTSCTLGLGAPSSQWSDAATAGISALGSIGQGTLTISNGDVTLVAAEGTPRSVFDRVVGDLDSALPEAFSLNAVRLEPQVETEAAPDAPEFVATRSPEGLVRLTGRLSDARAQQAVESFSRAAFGADNVNTATRVAEGLPPGWPSRVLASLEALAVLNHGTVSVEADALRITGTSGNQQADDEVTRILTSKLGDGVAFDLDITYSEALDPLAAIPTPQECIARIGAAASRTKITFAPSSSDIEPDALPTIDAIAEILRDCQDVPIEIAGHTDSQGREVMNAQLSQARADAVLNAIMARRVFTSNLTAVGYGEANPIADNGTEDGREANRRIEFVLVQPESGDETAQEGVTE